MSAASYIRIWLASVSVILGTVAAFNLVIDPYDVSRLLEMPRLNAMKPAEFGRARLRKPFDLYFKSLVSATTVRDSIATISASWDGTPTLQHLPDGLLNIEQYFSAVGQPDYRSQFNGVDAAYLNSAYKPMLDRRAELERVGFDHSALTDMLRTAARFDLELHVFIPPGHARQAEVVRFLGLEPLFRQWLRELACVVASTESGKRSVRLWDFSGYNSVTTEPIPPFSSKDRMQWYRDSVHFSRRTGRAIVDTVLGFPPSELGKDQTFGVQVTPANIDEYFEHRRLARERCLAANPEIGTEIATLYQGKTVPRVQPDSLAGLPKPCAATLANGRGQNAMTMSKLVTL